MDRQIIYPGQIAVETDLLNTNRNTMIAIGKLAGALFGTGGVTNGLVVGPSSPAALTVDVAPGEIYQLENVDNTAYSSLPADTTDAILKQGIMLAKQTLACAAPATAGYSINYLIQATYQDSDTGAVALPYYNASNPAQAYSGPNNTGATQATKRAGIVVVSAKAGTAATTGTQTTPAADSGYIALASVTVANGQATITSGNITAISPASPPMVDTSAIYADLASTATGKGGALVGFLQPGTGAIARTIQDKLRESVSVKDFGAAGDGVADDTTAIQAAITALQGGAISRDLIFPPGNYLVTGTLTCTAFLSFTAQGKFAAHIVKSNAGDLLSIGSGIVNGIVLDHQGASGSSIVNTADNLQIKDCGFNPGASNASPIVVLKHANCVVRDCTFTTSNAAQWCVDVVADTGGFCINGSIDGSTMYGNGNGVRFRTGTGGRPEGWDVTEAKIIVSGAASIEVQACLSINVNGCTLDQSSGYGVRLAPAGGGIDALSINGSYISTASAATTGFGIASVAGSGGIRSLSVVNNHIEVCGTGCVIDSQMSGIRYIGNTSGSIAVRHLDYAGATAVAIANNFFLGSVNLLRLIDGASGGQVSVTGNNFDTTGSVTYTPTDPTRFEFSANTGKKFSGWSSLVTGSIASGTSGYYLVPHGLAVTPSLGKVVATTALGTGGFINPTCTVVSVDPTNVQVQASYTVSTAGTLRINVHASA